MEKFQEPRAGQAPFSLPHLLTPLDSDSCRLHLLAGIAFAANEVFTVTAQRWHRRLVWSGLVCSGQVFMGWPQLFASLRSSRNQLHVLSRNLPWTLLQLVVCRLAVL